MIRNLIYSFAMSRPCRVIHEECKPYLERYFLFKMFGVRCYLHRFVASDPDRGLHDHPWPWAFVFVLWGWYWEHNRFYSLREKKRWFNFLLGESFHRVVIPAGKKECWTIFIHRDKSVKKWGFLKQTGADTFTYYHYKYKEGKIKEWQNFVPKGRDYKRDENQVIIVDELKKDYHV